MRAADRWWNLSFRRVDPIRSRCVRNGSVRDGWRRNNAIQQRRTWHGIRRRPQRWITVGVEQSIDVAGWRDDVLSRCLYAWRRFGRRARVDADPIGILNA